MKLLRLIRTLVFFFTTTDSLLMLYFALVRSKLQYASVAWNYVTITDSNKLERVRRKFAALCQKIFCQDVVYSYQYDAAVNNLTATVRKAINLAIPYVRPKNFAFPPLFSNLLTFYIKKKNQYFEKCNKSKFDHHYSAFTYYRKLVKTITKTDRLRWLHYIEDNLKTKPKDFWK
jgi:hypothetical protein